MRKAFRLTPRDYDLFDYLLATKVAMRSQICRDIFFGTHPSNTATRLKALELGGYLSVGATRTSARRLVSVYSLSAKSFAILRSHKEISAPKRVQLRSASVAHDLALVDIRQKILGLKMVRKYLPENTFLGQPEVLPEDLEGVVVGLRPDAVVQIAFESGAEYLALEYETSLKSMARCRDKLVRYHLSREVPAVLFICSSKKVFSRFYKIEKELFEKYGSKIFFILADELENVGGELKFRSPADLDIRLS